MLPWQTVQRPRWPLNLPNQIFLDKTNLVHQPEISHLGVALQCQHMAHLKWVGKFSRFNVIIVCGHFFWIYRVNLVFAKGDIDMHAGMLLLLVHYPLFGCSVVHSFSNDIFFWYVSLLSFLLFYFFCFVLYFFSLLFGNFFFSIFVIWFVSF